MSRRLATWAAALLFLTLPGCGDAPRGAKAYREGRYKEALASFDAAAENEGDRASAVLLYDRALAALQVGDLEKAETSARALAAKGTEFEARRDLVLGNIAFARSVHAETPLVRGIDDPRPAGLDRALVLVEDALASWRRAAVEPSMGPEARRNVERGLLRWDALRKAKSESTPGRDPKAPPAAPSPSPGKEPKPPPNAPPPISPLPQPGGDDPSTATVTTELPATEVMRLLEVLGEKEKQKVTLRRARRIERAATVEKDW